MKIAVCPDILNQINEEIRLCAVAGTTLGHTV